jgi:hypothetical protein
MSLRRSSIWDELRRQVAAPDAWWRDEERKVPTVRTPRERAAILADWHARLGRSIDERA